MAPTIVASARSRGCRTLSVPRRRNGSLPRSSRIRRIAKARPGAGGVARGSAASGVSAADRPSPSRELRSNRQRGVVPAAVLRRRRAFAFPGPSSPARRQSLIGDLRIGQRIADWLGGRRGDRPERNPTSKTNSKFGEQGFCLRFRSRISARPRSDVRSPGRPRTVRVAPSTPSDFSLAPNAKIFPDLLQ